MTVKLLGYSERGMINAICDDIHRADNPVLSIFEFLSWFHFPSSSKSPNFCGIHDATLLVEQSFSDFGDLDLLVLLDQEQLKQAVLIEAKVATDSETGIRHQWKYFKRFLGGEPNFGSSLFVQLFRKKRLIELLANEDAKPTGHPIWGRQSLGRNKVVTQAAKMLSNYRHSPWFLALVPGDPEETARFVEEELSPFVPSPEDLPGWSIERFGFLTWSEVEANCRKSQSIWDRTLACFEWNSEQIYRRPRV